MLALPTTARLVPLLLLACAKPSPPPVPEPLTLHPEATAGVANPTLARLLHDHWEDTLVRSPEWATMLGDRRYDHLLGDASTLAETDRFAAARDFLLRARSIDTATLSTEDKLTLGTFIVDLQSTLADETCQFGEWSLTASRNALSDLARTIEDHPLDSPEAVDALAARIEAMPARIDDELERLKYGLINGRVAGSESVRRTLDFIDRTLALPEADSPLYAPLRADSDHMTDVQRMEHATRVKGLLLPAIKRYRGFVETRILPKARPPEAATLTGLPDGAQCYASLIRRHTTLPVSADEVHQVGLREIARVHAEFDALAGRVYGESHPEVLGDRAALFALLRTDPALRFDTPESIVATAEASLREAEAAVPKVFHSLPETPCVVEPVPIHAAPFTYVAWYEPPVLDRPGIYRVNTYAPETRLRHEARALAFHESVPGHHLQIALTKELDEVPAFRRHTGVTAYREGWALYAERLADELGLYPTDIDRLGMLSYDAWRSARLVVDTGLHHHGWTRAQAETWMKENTPLAENNITNEVDRYIGWPGQALGYKMGQLALLDMRKDAETTLGDDFLLADFHQVVLETGPVPLPVLQARVNDWLEAKR